MADHKELLKSMLQDYINDKQEQSSATLHQVLVQKMQQVAGIGNLSKPDLTGDTDTTDE